MLNQITINNRGCLAEILSIFIDTISLFITRNSIDSAYGEKAGEI